MLVLTVSQGDYLMIGDNIQVHFDGKVDRENISVAIDAPRNITILRGKLFEENIAEMAADGSYEAQLLSEKLKKEHSKRRKQIQMSKSRRDTQENRMAKGEIKPYNNMASKGGD